MKFFMELSMLQLVQKPFPVIVHIPTVLPIRRFVEQQAEILSEQVIYQKVCFRRVRRWLRGAHPKRGYIITNGYTGIETVEELDQIMAMKTFYVREKDVKCENECASECAKCPNSP